MKRAIFFMLLACSAGLVAYTTFSPSIPIGSPLPKPETKLTDISGREITLRESMQANGLLVMFSCNTCPVVRGYQERTRSICTYTLSKKMGVVLLNSNERTRDEGDSFDDMKSYANEQAYRWTYAIDKNNELADAFGANRTPECFLFNSDGKLVYKGAIDDNPQDASGVEKSYLKIAIDDMIAGKEIAVKETRSVGCSIKRR